MEKVYKIYKITNLINNKLYIGQTCMTISKRWAVHKSTRSCRALGFALSKYGPENFKIEWIASSNNKYDITYLEDHFMEVYQTLVPNGYNLRSATYIGEFNGSVRDRMSESQKYRHKHMSEAEKIHQLRGITEYINNKKRPIIGLNDTGDTIEFSSTTEAVENGYHVDTSLKDQYTKCNGYRFYYQDTYNLDEMSALYKAAEIEKQARKIVGDQQRINSMSKTFNSEKMKHRNITAVNPETGDVLQYRNQNAAFEDGHAISSIRGSLKTGRNRSKGYHFFKTTKHTIDEMFEIASEQNKQIDKIRKNGRKKAMESSEAYFKSKRKPLIGINIETYEYQIFESGTQARGEFSISAINNALKGMKRTTKKHHFQYLTKSIEEHIEITKELFKK